MPEQWTAEQAARAMGVVDEADGEGLGVEGAEVGEIGHEQPNARGGMRWVAGGTALAVVAAAAWWSGAGNRDSREIPVHAGADGAFIAGERTPNSGPGDFNSSNGSSHMKIQTTAAAALLGAAASAFQAQAGDAVQWRVEDGGNGHWYQVITAHMAWPDASQYSKVRGGHLVTLASSTEKDFVWSQASPILSSQAFWIGGFQSPGACEPGCGWRWMTDEPFSYTNWTPGEPNDYRINGNEDAVCTNEVNAWNDLTSNAAIPFVIEWSADCNSDGIVDFGQILNGQLPDTNTNNIPDCCEPGNNCCVGDIYENHIVDGGDLGVLLSEWGVVTPTTRSDLNRDGFVDGADLGRLLANWGPCGG